MIQREEVASIGSARESNWTLSGQAPSEDGRNVPHRAVMKPCGPQCWHTQQDDHPTGRANPAFYRVSKQPDPSTENMQLVIGDFHLEVLVLV